MSIAFQVFVDARRVPGGAAWREALQTAGFTVDLPAATDLATHSGYLPCPDERIGFELYREPFSTAPTEIGPAGIEIVGERDTAFTLRFSGRVADREAAAAAAAALASMSDGILFDAEIGHFIDAAHALAWARNEHYRPVATYRARSARRRGRIRASTVVRLLMLALVTIVFAMLFG